MRNRRIPRDEAAPLAAAGGQRLVFLLIAVAGFAAGFINVLAGGGSFITLPAMIAGGLTAIGANASSTVALFPAQAITTWGARKDMVMPDKTAGGISIKALALISVVGGLLGALLLLITPPGVFARIVPWLILFATAVFAQGSFGGGLFRGRALLSRNGVYAVQGLVSIYGGYFGGGIGIMMLAALTLFGLTDMRVMNSIKILLSMLMNIAAVATFVIAGLVRWPQTAVLCAGAVAGGLVGLVAAKRVPALWVRVFVIGIGLVLTVVFFFKVGLG